MPFGKIELYSEMITEDYRRGRGEHDDHIGKMIENLPADWGKMTPSPTYMKTIRGMDDSMVQNTP